jgi:hypothetical protein
VKLELTCDTIECGEKITVDWPEIIPGVLNYLAFLCKKGGDPGLALLFAHHKGTRGLTSGDEYYSIREIPNKRVCVTGNVGILEDKPLVLR